MSNLWSCLRVSKKFVLIIRASHMASRKKVLLKVIILGDSGYGLMCTAF